MSPLRAPPFARRPISARPARLGRFTRHAHAAVALLVPALVAVAVLLWSGAADAAFKPPALNGHVMDTAGFLTPDQVLKIDQKLDRARQETGFAIVVFIPGSLEGEDIADVAYTTFNAWKIGSAKGDDGVLLHAVTGGVEDPPANLPRCELRAIP